jgi:AcrR family transcriptional regulator
MRFSSGFCTRFLEDRMKRQKKPVDTVRKPLQERSRHSVAAIIEASAQVLREQGYKTATTNRIAERAGVSVGTLYQYFRTKDEIFDALIEKESAAYLAAIEKSISAIELPLDAAIRDLLEAGYAHHALIVGIREVMRHTPADFYSGRLSQIREDLHTIVVGFLESRAPLPPGLDDTVRTAEIMIAVCEGMTFFGRVDRTPEQLIDILAEALGRYLNPFRA